MGFSSLTAALINRTSRRRRTTETQDSKPLVVAPQIPQELLIEIFLRLPGKSVIRFKCVSKCWLSIFSSRYFCDRFHELSSRRQPRLFLTLSDEYDRCKPEFLYNAPRNPLRNAPRTTPSSIELNKYLNIREMKHSFLRLLRGFIGFTVGFEFRIFNPTTRQVIILPAVGSNDFIAGYEVGELGQLLSAVGSDDFIAGYEVGELGQLYFMGHDPVNDQYKVVCIVSETKNEMKDIRSEYWVLVLEAGSSWKRKTVAKDFHPHLPGLVEMYMNGILYYFGWIDLCTYVLVSFDVRSEEFNMIQVPRIRGEMLCMSWKRLTQLDYGGKVAVLDYTDIDISGKMDLWILEDWKKKEWSRKTMVLQPSQRRLVFTNYMTAKAAPTPKSVIFILDNLISPYYFLFYDLQTNDLKIVEIRGIPKPWFSRNQETIELDMAVMDPCESIKYLET